MIMILLIMIMMKMKIQMKKIIKMIKTTMIDTMLIMKKSNVEIANNLDILLKIVLLLQKKNLNVYIVQMSMKKVNANNFCVLFVVKQAIKILNVLLSFKGNIVSFVKKKDILIVLVEFWSEIKLVFLLLFT